VGVFTTLCCTTMMLSSCSKSECFVKSELSLQRVSSVVKKPVIGAERVSYGEAHRVAAMTERALRWNPVCVSEYESLKILESTWAVQRTTKNERFLYVVGS
jgi:hypothetical protein